MPSGNAKPQEIEEQVQRLVGGVSARDLLLGLVIFVAAIGLAWLARRLVRRVLRAHAMSEGVGFALSKLLSYLIVFVGLVAAVATMGVNVTALVAVSSALLIGLGFGLQNLIQNFVAGIVVLLESPVRRGDFVKVAELEGTVEDVGIRSSRILTRDGSTVVVPNFMLVSELVTNFSYPTQRQRISIQVDLPFDCDVKRVVGALVAAASTHERVRLDPNPEVRLHAFQKSGFRFELRAWVDQPQKSRRVESELRLAVVEAFRALGIPFAIPELSVRLPEAKVRAGPTT